MATPSRRRQHRRPLRNLIAGSVGATLGLGRTAGRFVRSVSRIRLQGPRQAEREDLTQHTVQELREQARKLGIKGRASMTKDQLIEALRHHRQGSA